MKQTTRDSIIKQIARLVTDKSPPSQQGTRRSKIIRVGDIAFSLVDDLAVKYDGLCRQLLQQEGWVEKFSEKYIDKTLQELLANIIKDGDINKTSHYFDKLLIGFEEYSKEQIVYVPLVGIQMHVDTLPIGKVVIKKMTEAQVNDLAKKIESIVLLSKHTAEEKEHHTQFFRQQILRELAGKVCAEYRVVAEPGRARERAEVESHRVLDLLRYCIPSLYPKGKDVAIGLQGEISFEPRLTPIISSDINSFTLDSQLVGPYVTFELSLKSMEVMKRMGVFKVSKVLEKSDKNLTDFEDTLLRGIHWYANSQTQSETENEFLCLVTCLETFLTPRDGNPIGTAIAEGVAIIIATGLENRKYLKKRVKDFYRMRSAVSHGGRKAILDTDLAELRAIARKLTMVMIERKDEFQSQQSLLNWIEDQKLG
jgi:hypothetical protein